jgi:serralysin
MQLNVTFDQNPATLPAGFVAAINYVVNYFDSTFTNPVTVNIHVGYGEIAGQSLATGALGESDTYIDSVSYGQALAALKGNQSSPTQLNAYSTLPASSPLPGGTLWMATAEEKALGLPVANPPPVDGYVGFSSVYPFSYGINSQPASGQYYFVCVVEHEITEVMGPDSWLGDGLGGTTSFGVMDLFRYSSPGVRDLTATPPRPYNVAYFSTDDGSTNLDNWNTNQNGDLGDWAGSAGADALLAFSSSGQINQFTTADMEVMNVLGWNVTVSRVVIETDAGTSLTLVGGQNYYLLNSSGSGPSVKYGGTVIVAGGPWTPIGAVQTASGYDVAWKSSDSLYTVWSTDSNGNYTSNLIPLVSGASIALESFEPTFGQDLNLDGTTGVTEAVISNDNGTRLTLVGSQNYYLLNSSGSGPSVKYGGTAIVAGGPWTPIGAVQTASGYDVAWKSSDGLYTVWGTDGNGNYTSNLIPLVSGTSIALESFEPTFGQDLNGDTVIGIPGAGGGASAGSVVSNATVTFSGDLTLGYAGNSSTSLVAASSSDATIPTRLAVFSQYMAASFATTSGDQGSSVVADPPSTPPSLLTRPH